MNNFKVGDLVHIKEDAEKYEDNDGLAFIEEMKPYCGKDVVIYQALHPYGMNRSLKYRVKGNSFLWSSRWIEKITPCKDFNMDDDMFESLLERSQDASF